MLALALVASLARAGCPVPYTREQYGEDIASAAAALPDFEGAGFEAAARSLEAGIPCVVDPIPVAAEAAADRFVGVLHWKDGDANGARAWFAKSLALDPTFDWGIDDVPEAHRLRLAFEEARTGGPPPVDLLHDGSYAVTSIERERPKAKTPLLVGGALGVVAGGFLYYQSARLHSEFEDATTADDIHHYQRATNSMVLASAGVAVAGLGVGYYGIILDAGPTIAWTRRF